MKIFLSSTYEDLAQSRGQIRQWLSGVFGVDLVVMETFGSDASPPDITSVRRVRECDVFIGVYGHRYGTVDAASGKSITELELDEAERSYSAGSLSDLLVYAIESSTSWLAEYKEASPGKQAALRRLRDKASKHTCPRFSSADELLFFIIRDVYRKITERLDRAPLKIRPVVLPPARILQEPVGMEFLQSSDQRYLIGRKEKVQELLKRLEDNPVLLLLGESGVGKTSLIHAGLLPEAVGRGWRVVYSRPLGLPSTDVIKQVQATIFENAARQSGSLLSTIAEVVAALQGQRVVLIIDQFEDILAAREITEVERLISALRELRLLATAAFRVLITYRADLEARLGGYWQVISGSPTGLPRVYVTGIDWEQAWEGKPAFALRRHAANPDSTGGRICGRHRQELRQHGKSI